jgi:DNA gyrase/topoisomerase IV subunit B
MSGGLHGVGVSGQCPVDTRVEVARDRQLYAQSLRAVTLATD